MSRFIFVLLFLFSLPSQALFICEHNGQKQVVQESQGAHCQPYVKGMFSKKNPPPQQALAVTPPQEALGTTKATASVSESASLQSDIVAHTIQQVFEKQEQTTAPVVEQVLTWSCPQGQGQHTVIESSDQPLDDCVAIDSNLLNYKGKHARAQLLTQPPTSASETAQDVYRCRDAQGKISYVAADQRHDFRDCSFWSRSFQSVKQSMQSQNYLHTPSESDPKRLLCSGAGEVIFNGQKHEYRCATHSYDYAAGSTGGEVRSATEVLKIEAHDLDYFNDSGHCGGTITAENGRVLHLEASKHCPPNVRRAVAKIEKAVRKALNIQVSGAFRERQKALAPQINAIAREIGVEPYFVHAIISAESAYKNRAKSRAGAMGLMQLMPATARRFGVTDAYNSEQNIRGGTTYLKWLLNEFNGDMRLAAAGYNAGEGNVRKYGYKIPPFVETRAYVPKVMEYYQRYRANPQEIGL